MFLKYSKAFILLFCMLIFSCSSDGDNEIEEPSGETFIKAQIGDLAWETNEVNGQLIIVPDEGGQRFDINAKAMRREVHLAAVDYGNTDGIMEPKVYDTEDTALILFYFGFDNDFWLGNYWDTPDFESEPDIKITFTASSETSVSGTFSGTFYRLSDETEFEGVQFPEILKITDGVFNNVPYESFTIPEGTLSVDQANITF